MQLASRLRQLIAGAVLTAVTVAAPGCAADTRYSQAQLDAIQLQELDVPSDRAYLAVVGALLEQRYQIVESDMEGGLLVASSLSGDEWSGFDRSLIQVSVQPVGAYGSSVRVSTSSDGQTRVNAEQIKRLHGRIDFHAHTAASAVSWEPVP